MAVGLAPTFAASILDAIANQSNLTAPTALYMQLHTGDPGAAGTSNVATETTRQEITAAFSAASGGTCTTGTAITWTDVAASETYSHYSVWSASSSGTFYWSGQVTANAVTDGDTFTIPIGDLDLTLTVAA